MARLIMLAAPLLAASMPAHAQLRDAMAMPVVEEDSIMKHIIELSGERYEGRLAGTLGYDEAARDGYKKITKEITKLIKENIKL